MTDATVTLTIDGREVACAPGTTILEAARTAGLDIPTLCQWRDLSPTGACRICVVEVAGARNLPAACSTPVAQGMAVLTESPRVVAARRALIGLLLANHPDDCLLCEKAGECSLQDLAYRYEVRRPEGASVRTGAIADLDNPFLKYDPAKCILCGRCVQVCHSVAGVGAIDFSGRGFLTQVGPALAAPRGESPCRFCGQCIEACPVGALLPKGEVRVRAWETERKPTVCSYCGVGCALDLHVKDGRAVGASARWEAPNFGRLCAKGKFGWDFLNHPDRLTTPLVRRNGRRDAELVPASWEEALSRVAVNFARIRREAGPAVIGVLSSAKMSNEENYLLQKLAREVLSTPHIDHCARLCHASTVAGLALAFGSGAMTNSVADLSEAGMFLVVGSNTTEAHPVIGMQIAAAVRRGAKLVVADPRETDLAKLADVHLKVRPGANVALLNSLAQVILAEGLADLSFVESRTEGFSEFAASLADYAPEAAAGVTGLAPERIRQAARLYAGAGRAAIVYSMGVTQFTSGTANVLAVANLALLTGNVGRPGTGVNPLRGQNNVQGACDMGALPDLLPGYRPASEPGFTVTQMLDAAAKGALRAMYVVGENPVVSDPDTAHVEEALRRLEFLVVQDLFLTETAQLADVVLPAAASAEKEGTFTSTERRIRHFFPAVAPPGEARPDWEIFVALAGRLGASWSYANPGEVMAEIAATVPIYGGISYGRLAGGPGLQWPCPDEAHPGTPVLHAQGFARGRGAFHRVEYAPPAEVPDDEFPFLLTTGRSLYHFHTGSMTRRSRALREHRPAPWCEMHPADAHRLGVEQGEEFALVSRRGRIITRCLLTTGIPEGILFTTFHFGEAGANRLTGRATDPVSRIPEFKVTAVRAEKLRTG